MFWEWRFLILTWFFAPMAARLQFLIACALAMTHLILPITRAQADAIDAELAQMFACVLRQCQSPSEVTKKMTDQCMRDYTVLEPEKYKIVPIPVTGMQVLKMVVAPPGVGPDKLRYFYGNCSCLTPENLRQSTAILQVAQNLNEDPEPLNCNVISSKGKCALRCLNGEGMVKAGTYRNPKGVLGMVHARCVSCPSGYNPDPQDKLCVDARGCMPGEEWVLQRPLSQNYLRWRGKSESEIEEEQQRRNLGCSDKCFPGWRRPVGETECKVVNEIVARRAVSQVRALHYSYLDKFSRLPPMPGCDSQRRIEMVERLFNESVSDSSMTEPSLLSAAGLFGAFSVLNCIPPDDSETLQLINSLQKDMETIE